MPRLRSLGRTDPASRTTARTRCAVSARRDRLEASNFIAGADLDTAWNAIRHLGARAHRPHGTVTGPHDDGGATRPPPHASYRGILAPAKRKSCYRTAFEALS